MNPLRMVFVSLSMFFALVLVLLGTKPAFAETIYVTPTGGSDGTSWNDPTTLSEALSTAIAGDEVWVAAGVHTPGATADNTFSLVPGVAVYGGFNGNETLRNQRNWQTHVTVLSGDIDNNDLGKDANGVLSNTNNIIGTNSLVVVFAPSIPVEQTDTRILDGFTITAGNNNVVPEDENAYSLGGGFHCSAYFSKECSPHLENVIFSGNSAADGGGGMLIWAQDEGVSEPTLKNVTFTNNTATRDDGIGGGALLVAASNSGWSTPVMENITFTHNSAQTGGAMYAIGYFQGFTFPSLMTTTFTNNSAEYGGALFVQAFGAGEGSPTLINATFTGNSADYSGGAMYNYADLNSLSAPTLQNVIFTNNSASLYGGAISNRAEDEGEASPSLYEVILTGNSAVEGGGAMYNVSLNSGISQPYAINSIFTGNTSQFGGAIYNQASGGTTIPDFINVTFAGNSASTAGGVMYSNITTSGTNSPYLLNNILWGNTAPDGSQIHNLNATAYIKTSLVQGGVNGTGVVNEGTSSIIDGGGNLDTDPLFVDSDSGNLRLTFGSPAIDAGTIPPGMPDVDIDNNPRITDGDGSGTANVDMGAHEAAETLSQALMVTLAGDGIGEVNRTPTGFACTTPCTANYPQATLVTLTAVPANGSTFAGWSGDCTGTDVCTVTMNAAKSVTATFIQEELESFILTVNVVGNGSVVKDPDQATYVHGAIVNITATANEGFTFTGWSGACTGLGACAVTMDSAKSVTATFTQIDTPGNNAPSFTSTPKLTATVAAIYTFAVVALDLDAGDTLSISAPLLPSWLTLSATGNGTALLTGTPTAVNIGAHPVQLRVQDAAGLFAIQEFTITVTATLSLSGNIQGSVVDSNGNPIAGATVTLSDANGEVVNTLVQTQISDANGNYLFTNVPPGNYTITVSIDNMETSAPIAVTVLTEQTTIVPDTTLQPRGTFIHLPMLRNAE